MGKLPRELKATDEVFGRRMRVLRAAFGQQPAAAGRRTVPGDASAGAQAGSCSREMSRTVAVGQVVPVEHLTAWMLERGMSRAEVVEVPGEFSVAGGILDVFPTDAADPVRIEFFGDEVESIRPFDVGIPALARPLDVGHPDGRGRLRRGGPCGLRPSGELLPRRDLGRARSSRPIFARRGAITSGRLEDTRGLYQRGSQFRAADPVSNDRGLDAGGRLARDDLPHADREHRAVFGRADQGQG